MLTLQGILSWSMPCSTVRVPCIAACHAAWSLTSDAKHSEACASGHRVTGHTAVTSHKAKRCEACEAKHNEQVGQSSSTPGWDRRDRCWLPDIPSGRIAPKGSDRCHSPLLDVPPEGMGGWIKQLGHGMSRVQKVTAAAMQP